MENNILRVKTSDNNDLEISVIDIIENKEANKNYIIYTINGSKDDVFMSILDEKEDSYTLKTIEDSEEIKMIENYYENLLGDGDL